MDTAIPYAPSSKRSAVTGHVLSGLAVLFLLFDAVIHILKIPPVVDAFNQLGYPASASVPLGIVELACVAIYLWPRTAALGAVLLTGYLGGAVAIHVRVDSPLFSHTLFPAYVGMLIRGGLYLRSEKLRALVTLRD